MSDQPTVDVTIEPIPTGDHEHLLLNRRGQHTNRGPSPEDQWRFQRFSIFDEGLYERLTLSAGVAVRLGLRSL